MGIRTESNPSPQRSMTLASGECWPRSLYHAPVAATHNAVVQKAANSICGQRTRTTGPVTIAHQFSGINLPLTTLWPRGACIQLLLHKIQKEENIVPSDTMQQAKR